MATPLLRAPAIDTPASTLPEVRECPWWAPQPIRRPVMVHRWEDVAFIHWPFDPELIQRLLPRDLEVDTFAGTGWVGIVAFRLTVAAPGSIPFSWVSTCPEINVRTYVRGPDTGVGIWFFSLEAARLAAVMGARGTYGLPYMWASMRMARGSGLVRYASRRRRPHYPAAFAELSLRLGDAIDPAELSPLDRFLTSRWRLYSEYRGGIGSTQVEHEPWPLVKAHPLVVRESLLTAAGLGSAVGDPLAHFSVGVEARFGPRRQVTGSWR
jgi:uncharacterized protein